MFIEKAYGQVLWFYGQEDVYVSCETQFQPSYPDAIFTCHKSVQTFGTSWKTQISLGW